MRASIAAIIVLLLSAPFPNDPEKEVAFHWIEQNAATTRKVSLNIWSNPELALREFKSSRELIQYLQSNGFRVEKGVAGISTSFVASSGSGKPVIAIYGEYDALAGLSQKAEPIRSPLVEEGPGHGCGHNLIGAASAAAAVAVSRAMEAGNLKGTIRFYGTPAEEAAGGKNYMLEAGLFKDVDILLGWHPGARTQANFEYSKAVTEVRFKFKGVAAHASSAPHLGRSALDGVELMDVGVNFMREHVKEDSRIHYVITKGGGQPNVVPADAESWYYIRANKHQDVLDMFEWISHIAEGAALMSRTQVEIQVADDSHEVLANRPLAEAIDRNLHLVGPPKFTEEERTLARKMQEPLKGNFQVAFAENIEPLPDQPAQGLYSTDLGNVSWNVPSGSLGVVSYPFGVPIHSWQVAACAGMSIGQKAIDVAAKTLAGTAIDLFKNPALVEASKKDFQERKKGYNYRLLLPPNRKAPVFQEAQ